MNKFKFQRIFLVQISNFCAFFFQNCNSKLQNMNLKIR